MTRDFDSEIELPWRLKLRLAGYAFAGAAVGMSLVGVILKLAVLDSFEAALANLGISAPNLLSLPMILSVLLILVGLFSLGLYSVLCQFVQKRIAQLCS